MIDGMLTIDAHCHIGDMKGRHGVGLFTAEDMLARMDRNGVDKAVVCSVIAPLWGKDAFIRGNDLTIEAVKKYPDRFLGLCVVNPKDGAFAEEEARRGLAAGLKGLKLHPILHGYYPIDGPLMDPLMSIAAHAGVPVVTHSDYSSRCCTPYQVARLAARFPQVTVVLLHLGQDAESVAHTPEAVAPYANLVVETSNAPDYPHAVFVQPSRELGAGRVMFGSDGPVVSIEAALAKLAAAEETYGLTKDEKRQILGESAARVFGFKR